MTAVEKHGLTGTRVYKAWDEMKQRCYNPNHIAFDRYGGRGITVCEQWIDDPVQFYNDMGHPPEGLSLDRINNNGDYTPNNCKWSTNIEQHNNRRDNVVITLWGINHTLAEWCRILDRDYRTIQRRIDTHRWTPYAALTTPTKKPFTVTNYSTPQEV